MVFSDLLRSTLQIRKAQLQVSDHQEILSVQMRMHFSPSCNQLVQNSASIRYLPKDIHMRRAGYEAMSLPEHQTASHRGLMFPIFVKRGEMSQALLTLVCLWISDHEESLS